MVVVGALVKEESSEAAKARVGAIVKVTPLILSNTALKQYALDVERSKQRLADMKREYDPVNSYYIRSGKVFSVRWQDEPTKVTVHVAYDDCNGHALINIGSNAVSVVK